MSDTRARVHGEEAYRHLSASERAVLDDVIATYGSKPIGALIELTHREYAWRQSDKFRPYGSSAPMPYELFFEGEHTESSAQTDDRND